MVSYLVITLGQDKTHLPGRLHLFMLGASTVGAYSIPCYAIFFPNTEHDQSAMATVPTTPLSHLMVGRVRRFRALHVPGLVVLLCNTSKMSMGATMLRVSKEETKKKNCELNVS